MSIVGSTASESANVGLTEPIPAVGYARVSTDEQAKNQSLGVQAQRIREYARDNGYVIGPGDIFVDAGVSGATPFDERPEFPKACDAILSGQAQAIIVVTRDRFARAVGACLYYEDEAKRHGAAVVFVEGRTFGDDAIDQLMRGVEAGIAGFEKAKILDRTMRGRIALWDQGEFAGGSVLYGYQIIPTLKTWAIQADQAEVVRRVFRHYLVDGLGYHAIAKRLTHESIPPPSAVNGRARHGRVPTVWSPTTIGDMLRNPSYAGRHSVGRGKNVRNWHSNRRAGHRVAVEIPHIIDDRTFELAAERRKRRWRGMERKGQIALQGRVWCGACGLRMQRGNNGPLDIPVHACPNRSRSRINNLGRSCVAPRPHAADVHDAVVSSAVAALRRPALSQRVLQAAQRRLRARHDALIRRARPAEADLADVKGRLERLTSAYTDGTIDRETFDRLRRPLLGRANELGGALTHAADAKGEAELLASQVRAMGEALSAHRARVYVARGRGTVAITVTAQPIGGKTLIVGAPDAVDAAAVDFEVVLTDRQLIEWLDLKVTIWPDRLEVTGMIPTAVLKLRGSGPNALSSRCDGGRDR